MFKSISRRKVFEEVADQIRAAIEEGRYGLGDDLPSEKELMEAFGVGRPAIRNALLTLQVQGLVVVQHGRRGRVAERRGGPLDNLIGSFVARVTPPSGRLVDDILEARLALELTTARRAAECASPTTLKVLRAALDANRRAIPERDGYLKSDIAFHRAVAEMTGNVIFVESVEAILQWLARFRDDLIHVEGSNLLSHHEHTAIADAIASGDPDAAVDTMRRHATRAHALYGTLIRGGGRRGRVKPSDLGPASSSRSR